MSRFPVVVLVILSTGCAAPEPGGETGDSTPEQPVLDAPAAGEGFQVSMFATAPAHSEVWLCSVYHLPTTDTTPVNRVRYLQNDGTHHMSLSTTVLSTAQIDDGTYDCNDLYVGGDLMQDAVTFFGNQGAAEGELVLPEGVAAMLPGGIQVVHEVHYVNGSDADVELYSYINAYTIPTADVTDTIWGGQVRDETISLPAHATHTEWTRCVMNQDVQVHFLASHSHALGRSFTIAPFDGTTTGAVFYENTDWHDPMIVQYPEPLVVPQGQGFEYACTWQNDSDAEVNYGLTASDEMCNMAIVFTPGNPSARCEVVETSDGVLWAP